MCSQVRASGAWPPFARHVLLSLWLLLTALIAGAPATAQGADEGLGQSGKPLWPHIASDIAPDPAVTFGVLPNGMRYAIMPNQLPPGAVSMRFAVAFGSLYESEEEQGLAHFIEHMAFNGSTNVPEGEMVKILERLGLSFGADTNASTGQFDTIYMLDLPNASDTLIDESLFLLRETASELTFSPEAIERERGVVLAEYRRGDTFSRRRSQQQIDFLIPGAAAAARMPIGKADVIATVQRDTFVSLYDRYYRPERAVLVIVGDIDPAAIEARISDRFSDWTARGPAGDEPDLAYALTDRDAEVSVYVHPDGGDSIGVYLLSPYENPPDTAANRRENNLMSFATGALSRRLSRIANEPEPPYRRATLSHGDILRAANAAMASVSVPPGGWRLGLMAIEQEWRRALEHGFTEDEIAQQLVSMRTSQENAAQRENTRTTGQLVSQLLSAILDDRVFALPSSGLTRFDSWAPDVTPETVQEVFVHRMERKSAPLFFLASTLETTGIESEVIAAWEESAAEPVDPPASISAGPFAYTDFGPAGEIVLDTRREDIATRMVVFENGVRLSLKQTEFQRNVVLVSVRVSGGLLALEDAPYGLGALMRAYGDGGLEEHSADELRVILSGRAVQTGFSASATAFGGTYTTTPADLELQMQVAAAFLTSPGYRETAERRWRQNIVLAWPRYAADAPSVMANQGMRLLASGDRRFGADPNDGIESRSFIELRGYAGPLMAEGAIEIAIVGDLDEAAAIEAVAKTFGALPERKSTPEPRRSQRPVVFREDRTPIVLQHTGEPEQAQVNLYWPISIDPDEDPQGVRVLSVLSSVMRLKIINIVREELGASYSPSASASVSSYYPGWGYLSAGSEVRPDDVDEVAEAIRGIAASLRNGEISEDEFQRAITPALEQLPRNASSNSYWLSLIAQAQTRPELVDRRRVEAVEEGYRAITVADLVEAANRWLAEDAMQQITVLPGAER